MFEIDLLSLENKEKKTKQPPPPKNTPLKNITKNSKNKTKANKDLWMKKML